MRGEAFLIDYLVVSTISNTMKYINTSHYATACTLIAGSSPGPAHYHPDHAPTLHKSPAFTMGYRRQRTASNDSTLSII